jgi:Mg-chelatase subunit ChlD
LLLALALAVLVLAVGAVAAAIFHSPSSQKEEDVPFEEGPPPIEVKKPSPPQETKEKPPPRPPVVERPRNDANPRRTKPLPPLALREMTRRPVEVVFCIDTTGSMGGLLRTATARIWTLCSQIARGKPTPDLKVGIVAYRDKGDDYITRVIPLSRDLDAIHGELEKLKAQGGGDTPEHVNAALYDAVHKIKWSTDRKAMKLIFLVGDAPPHMDYPDDVKYPETCKAAVEKGIIINAVQCGEYRDCKQAWQDIARKGAGEYVAIPQTGGLLDLKTPYDTDLVRLGEELYRTALFYGPDEQKRQGERMLDRARELKGTRGADRAVYAARSRSLGPYDLLDAVSAKRVKLEDVKPDDLPDAMKGLKDEEALKRYLADVQAKREKLRHDILALEEKRSKMLRERLAKEGGSLGTFDRKVLAVLRQQAKKFEIKY